MDVLEIDNISLSFGGVNALTDVSMSAAAGKITAVIGPNGAGKTSLFNVVSGFYKPNHGAVRMAGVDITAVRPHRRAFLGIARTFQNVALFRGMTVLDNIKLGAHTTLRSGPLAAGVFLGRTRREESALREQIEREVISLLELDHIRHKPVQELSYGLQKRVELARALVMRPKLLLLDEPVAGMNREEKGELSHFILEARERWQTTVLLIEHDMGMVMDLSDRVVVLNFGRNIAAGTSYEVKHNPEVISAYLGRAEAS
ncbi:MAG: ABC transporter ATP-binding protein [Candidatus Lambdaproteobacteria bacterium]|nr:ABC transporter ATP-binding protein [Candidatus Lambdaproteobacteria bacterium]